MQRKISRNWAIVPTGHHKGAGENRNKNLPDDSGYINFSSGLGFLYKQKEKAEKAKKGSFLLGVLHCAPGYDSVKRRLNFYGLFGKASQNSPSKKFDQDEVESIFLFGGKVTPFQAKKLDDFIAAIERSLGDKNATGKNHRQSPLYQEALNVAERTQILVQAKYDSQYYSVDEEDPTRASLSLGYVVFSTGRLPVLANLDPADSDDLQELVTPDGKKVKGDPIELGAVSFSATRSYLKNYGGGSYNNLRCIQTSEDQSFWTATLGSFPVENLGQDFFRNFDQELIDRLKELDVIKFSGVLKSERDISQITNFENEGDAVLTVVGQISTDDSDGSLYFYESEPDDSGNIQKGVIFKVRQLTLYTNKLL